MCQQGEAEIGYFMWRERKRMTVSDLVYDAEAQRAVDLLRSRGYDGSAFDSAVRFLDALARKSTLGAQPQTEA